MGRWLGGGAALLVFAAAACGGEEVPVLVRAIDVRTLDTAEADAARPVLLEGVVTHYHRRLADGFFLQDETDGIYVSIGPLRPSLATGERVRVTGVTAAGGFAPVVILRQWESLGMGALPEAEPVSAAGLASGRFDSRRVQLRGVVRSVVRAERNGVPHLALELRADGRDLLVGINEFSPASLELADAEVVVRGVAAGVFSYRRQLLSPVVLLESEAEVEVVDPPRPAEALPVRRIETLFRHSPEGFPDRRVRLQAELIGRLAGRWLAVRDGTGGLFVDSPDGDDLALGDRLELTGFPALREQTLWLLHAQVRRLGPGEPVAAEDSTVAIARGEPNELRRLEGTLVGPPRPGEGTWVLTLREDEHEQFEAWVPAAGGPFPSAWREGARLRLTGITEPLFLTTHRHEMVPFPQGLRLHARTPGDVIVVRAAPWSTSPHFARVVSFALAGLLVLLGSVTAVAAVLARKNRTLRQIRRELRAAQEVLARRYSQRTGEWQEELAARHAAEADFALLTAERTRLARELHDTLEQSLASVGLHLDAARGFFRDAPAESERLLIAATDQLRESQAEVRRSVWNLRAVKLEEATLPDALAQLGHALADPQGPSLEVVCAGEAVHLPPWIASHLFRVAQEGVTNALKHAAATTVRVELAFGADGVTLTVVDDGCGFDAAAAEAEGHFGLRGLRERAVALGGELALESRPEKGTRVRLTVPAARLRPG
jgi:signal transduction histidine kinase